MRTERIGYRQRGARRLAALLLVLACGVGCQREQAPSDDAAGLPPAPAQDDATAPPQDDEAPRAPSNEAPSTEATRETLTLEGTPPIPDALRDRLNQYLNVRSARLEALADDGGAVLITTRFAETSQLHVVSDPLAMRHQLTFEPEPVRSASFAPGDPQSVLYLKDEGGDEQYQLYRLDRRTGRTTRVTSGAGRVTGYLWSDGGERLVYSSTERNDQDFDLHVFDGAALETSRLLYAPGGYLYPLDWSGDAGMLLAGEYRSVTDSRLHLIDVATGEGRLITPEDAPAAHPAAVFVGEGHERLFVTSDRGGEFVDLYEVDLASGAWRVLTDDISWDVEELAISHDGATLAFVTNEDGYSALYLLDVATRARRRVEALPRGIVSGLTFAREAPTLGFTFTSAAQTGDVYLYEIPTASLTRWTQSEVGGLDTSRFVEPELIHYESFDGRQIPAFYYEPPGDGPHPVLISIHGGPESQSRPWFVPIRQFFALELGVAMLVPNVRGSQGYGKSYVSLDNARGREDSVKDIGALLDWIATQPALDASRVGVTGGSYGGYMVLASLIHFGERLVAGTDVVGISSFVTFLENTKPYRQDLRRVEYGDERDEEMRAFLETISPLNRADEIKSALFVAHGANDPRVPLSEAEQLVEEVRAAGQDVWLMVAHNEGHGFRKKENRDTFALLQILFFAHHFKLALVP